MNRCDQMYERNFVIANNFWNDVYLLYVLSTLHEVVLCVVLVEVIVGSIIPVV